MEVDEHLVVRVQRRHRGLVYVLESPDRRVVLHMPGGVVVGDPLGPLLFILYYSGYMRDLQARRRQGDPSRQLVAVLATAVNLWGEGTR